MRFMKIKRLSCIFLSLLLMLTTLVSCTNNVIQEGSLITEEDSSEASQEESIEQSLPEEVKKPESIDPYEVASAYVLANSEKLGEDLSERMNEEFLDKITAAFGEEKIELLAKNIEESHESVIKSTFGYSEKAFISIVENDLERTVVLENDEDGITEFVFVGDCSFANSSSVMRSYKNRKKGVEGIVSQEVLEIMRSANVAMANNEFTFTNRGEPIPGKRFTFRGDPENVNVYHEMGVDIVGMANNHAFDYGPDSLTDTLSTLDSAGIAHVGAGENINDARAPFYYIVNGFKYAVIAGSSVDFKTTRCATDEVSGVFQFKTPEPMAEEIAKAKEKADYVIVYMHWGKESTTVLTDMQTVHGKAFIDAGADIVVGMHSHCMQGMEYYNGKLLVYSLGNFTFSNFSLTCGMLRMGISPDGNIENTYYPMMQTGNRTYINTGSSGDKQLARLRRLLINAEISDEFIVTEKND